MNTVTNATLSLSRLLHLRCRVVHPDVAHLPLKPVHHFIGGRGQHEVGLGVVGEQLERAEAAAACNKQRLKSFIDLFPSQSSLTNHAISIVRIFAQYLHFSGFLDVFLSGEKRRINSASLGLNSAAALISILDGITICYR